MHHRQRASSVTQEGSMLFGSKPLETLAAFRRVETPCPLHVLAMLLLAFQNPTARLWLAGRSRNLAGNYLCNRIASPGIASVPTGCLSSLVQLRCVGASMQMRCKPRLITLDSTGTLMQIKKPVGELYASAILTAAPSLADQLPNPDMLANAFYAAYKSQDTAVACFGAGTPGGCRQWWSKVVRQTLVNAGIAESTLSGHVFELIFEMLYDDFFNGEKAWELLPTTTAALRKLRQWCDANGCILGVMSNMDERLDSLIQKLGIASFFDFVLTSYGCGAEKPSADIFEAARKLAGINTDALAVHCGDSYKRDVVGAVNSGFVAALVDPTATGLHILDEKELNMPGARAYGLPHIGHVTELLS